MGHSVFDSVIGALGLRLLAIRAWANRGFARSALVAGATSAALLTSAHARAADPDVFARVVVSETELRSGPGISYRAIQRVRRGEVFLVKTRETKGFWLQVELPDGRTAYVLGDTVATQTVDSDAPDAPHKPGLFAPPALQSSRAGFTLLAGLYDGSGYAEIRPALVIAPAIAFEPYVGVALGPDSRRLIYGGAGTLNLAPDWAIAPFFEVGLGGVLEQPKDEFVRPDRKWFHARAGGGLLVSLRLRLLLRLEVSNVVLFNEDDYQNRQAYLAGLGTYF
ncbi:MAG TPA: SH3 domain-containing protein [Polyangiaceae bacterium]|nr:SH3 domain-containing protein [Polyangiaceae bacterium]